MPAMFALKSGRALCAITLALLTAGLLGACQKHPNNGETAASANAASSPGSNLLPAPSPFNVEICVNDNCGVLDQNGKVLMPFDEDAGDADVGKPVSNFIMRGTVTLMNKNGQWQLVDLKTHALIKAAGEDIYDVGNPDYFGFKQDGKVGLMDLMET